MRNGILVIGMKSSKGIFSILLIFSIQTVYGQFWNQQIYKDSFFVNSAVIKANRIKEVTVRYSYKDEAYKLYHATFNSQGKIVSENYPYDDSTSIQYVYNKSGVIEKAVNTTYKLHVDNTIRDSTVEVTEYCDGKKFKQITYHPSGYKTYCSYHYPDLSCAVSDTPESVHFYFNNRNQIDSSKGTDFSSRRYYYDDKGKLIRLKTSYNYPTNYTGLRCEYYGGDCAGENCVSKNQQMYTEYYRDSVVQYDINMKGVVYLLKNGLPKSIKLFCLTQRDEWDCDPKFVELFTFRYKH